jgi:hypothetical protein
VRRTEVLPFVHEHVIGDVRPVRSSGPPQVRRRDGRRLSEVDGSSDAGLRSIRLDDIPDRSTLGPV